MKKLLWLDDFRDPFRNPQWLKNSSIEYPFETIWVKDYNQFVNWIKLNGLPDGISFDHDLADEHYNICNNTDYTLEEYYLTQDREMTGYDCAKWLVDYCIDNKVTLPKFEVHSMNIVGGENIRSLLNHYNRFKR